jgi:tol-pal system protein YbgF
MHRVYFLAAAALVFLVSGCASRFSESDSWRLQQVEKGLYNLQEKQRYKSREQEELKKRVSRLESRIQEVESDPREFAVTDLDTEDGGFVRGPAPGEDSVQVKNTDSNKSEQSEKEKVSVRPRGTKPAMRPSETENSAKNNAGKNGAVQEKYTRALDLLQNDKPGPSRERLIRLKESYPQNSLQPNFQYWIGETYYSQKRYAQAILAFKQVVQNYPKSNKAPAALLKISYSYSQLGDKQNAAFYKRVLSEDYPDSEAAAKLK